MYDVNLYPPIFNQPYMPAFIYTGSCRVYFQISPLNTVNDLFFSGQGIQVSVRKQTTNEDALADKYISDIMIKTLQTDLTREGDDKYYIEINSSDLKGGFVLNQYYKVQLRFTGRSAEDYDATNDSGNAIHIPSDTTSEFGAWLGRNLQYFSEWSSVVLIRGIGSPSFAVGVNGNTNNSVSLSTDYTTISARASFIANDSERLERCRVCLYDNQNTRYQIQLTGNRYTLTYTYESLPSYSNIRSNNQYFINGTLVTITALDITNKTITVNTTLNSSYNWTNQTVTIIEASLIEDSEDICAENNAISYTLKTALSSEVSYALRVNFITSNLYQSSVVKTLTHSAPSASAQQILMQELVDNSNGCIKLRIRRDPAYINNSTSNRQQYYRFYKYNNYIEALEAYAGTDTTNWATTIASWVKETVDGQEVTTAVSFLQSTVQFNKDQELLLCLDDFTTTFLAASDNMVIRRSSSKTNFKEWDLLDDFWIPDENSSELYWYDYTAEPGIWYRYQVVRSNSNGTRLNELVTNVNKPVMLDTEDIFLNANGEELIVRFDPSISNFSTKIAETITDTVGSKYPFFRRNGNVNYKTFSLSGTISCFMDLDNNFNSSPDDLYGDSAKYYKQYNKDHNISMYNDAIYERHFRDKVMQFLYSSDVKLLRSVTEGNILVKLSNISFTPNQTLGRQIYNFSCTAYEVADCNEKNYRKYNIIKDNIKLVKKGQE